MLSLKSLGVRLIASFEKYSVLVTTAIGLTVALGILLCPTQVRAQTYPGQIGVEEACAGMGPFVDAAKMLRPFTDSNGNTIATDSNGWPTSDGQTVIFDERPIPAWAPPIDDPAEFQPNMAGAYTLVFNGQATIGITDVCPATISNQTFNSGTNTTTATVTMPAGGYTTAPDLLYLTFKNTIRTVGGATNTGITNLQCYFPGYAPTTTQVFTTPFLNAFAPFDHIRFMGFKDTNYNAGYYGDPGHHLINWSDRGLPTDCTQTEDTPLRPGCLGAAWEYVILMANATNKDVWINIPVSATGSSPTDTTSYIYNLALLFKNGDAFTGNKGLNPGLHIYIEHSNEVWNSIFTQYTWNLLAAEAEVAAGGSPLNNDGNTNSQTWAERRHAKRLYEIANIFAQVYGSGSLLTTIRPVYASFVIGAQEYYTNVLSWMNSTYGAPSNYFYALAGTSYFSETPTAGESISTIESNMQAGSDANLVYSEQLRAVANTYGLKQFSYEGGPDNGGGSTTNVGNRILANRDPGMVNLIEHDIRTNYFGQAHGDSYNYFTLCGQYSRYGCYGASEDIANVDTYKWQAIYNLTGYNYGGAPPAPTGLGAVAGNTQVILTWNSSSGATSYDVYRATTSGGEGGAPLASGISSLTYTNTGLANGTTYYYTVSAVNSSGTSAQSSEVSAIPTSPPSAPTGLSATPGNTQVSLSWNVSTGATSYNVGRSTTSGGSYTTVASPSSNSDTDSGLTNGTTYYYVVSAINGAGTSANSSQVSATPQPTVPTAPTGLTATPGNTQVSLSWTASSGATSYNALRSTVSGSGYASVATGITTTGYTNTGLTNGTTYYYVVQAVNAAGTSANSAQASATPTASTGTLLASEPFAESTGVLNGASGGTGFAAAWTTQNGDTTVPGYNILSSNPLTFTGLSTSGNYGVGGNAYLTAYRGIDVSAGGNFGGNGYVSGGLVGVSGKTLWMSALVRKDTSTEDPNFVDVYNGSFNSPLVAMGYFGASSDSGGNRFWSLEIGSTVYQTTSQITVGTSALLVVEIQFGSTNTVSLFANPSSLGGNPPGSASASGTTGSSLAFSSLAYYGGNSAGASSIDEIRFGTTFSAVTPTSGGSAPPAPTGLTATPGNAQAALSWTASSGATSYTIWASTGGNYYSAGTSTTTSFTNTGLTNGTTYSYYVTASNASGTSGPSNIVTATPNVVPAAPTGLTATAGSGQVALSWTASSGATSYNVQRSTVSGSGFATVTTGVSTTAYTNTGLTNGTTYYFVVQAVNSAGTSGSSNQASATPQTGAPSAPTGLTATPGNAQVALSWTASSGATSYNVQRSTVSGSGYATVVTGNSTTAYTNTGLTNGTTYYFIVQAVNAGGTSGNSNQASATPSSGGGGTLLATEEFTESTGALNGANGGSGFSGAWQEQNGRTDVPGYNILSTSPLSYTGLATSGNYAVGGEDYESSGRGFNLSGSGPFSSYLTGGAIGASGTTIWMSALIRKDANNEDPNYLLFINGGTVWYLNTPLVGAGYFGSGSDNGGTRYWSLEVGSTVYRTTIPATVGSTALVVVEITFGSTNTVNLYVNPSSLGGSAPSTASATATTTSSIAFQDLAWMGGYGAGDSSLDEIRVGTTYAIVTP